MPRPNGLGPYCAAQLTCRGEAAAASGGAAATAARSGWGGGGVAAHGVRTRGGAAAAGTANSRGEAAHCGPTATAVAAAGGTVHCNRASGAAGGAGAVVGGVATPKHRGVPAAPAGAGAGAAGAATERRRTGAVLLALGAQPASPLHMLQLAARGEATIDDMGCTCDAPPNFLRKSVAAAAGTSTDCRRTVHPERRTDMKEPASDSSRSSRASAVPKPKDSRGTASWPPAGRAATGCPYWPQAAGGGPCAGSCPGCAACGHGSGSGATAQPPLAATGTTPPYVGRAGAAAEPPRGTNAGTAAEAPLGASAVPGADRGAVLPHWKEPADHAGACPPEASSAGGGVSDLK